MMLSIRAVGFMKGVKSDNMLLSVFIIVSFRGHDISKYISFSDYRWQCLYCLMMSACELLAGGIRKWGHNLERRIKRLDLENSIFLQTKQIIYLIKTPKVIFLTVGSY